MLEILDEDIAAEGYWGHQFSVEQSQVRLHSGQMTVESGAGTKRNNQFSFHVSMKVSNEKVWLPVGQDSLYIWLPT